MIFNIPSCFDCKNTNSPFCNLSKLNNDIFTESKGISLYRKGQIVFYENALPNGVFCVKSGSVKIAKYGENGKEQVLRLAGCGDLLGYRAVLGNEPYFATATALEDSIICQVSKEKFFEVLWTQSKLANEIILMLSEDLKAAEKKVVNISQKQAHERIADALMMLADKFGFKSDGITLAITLTRRQIGDIAGTTPETVIRSLTEYSKKGILKLIGKNIQILNPNELQQI